jgi:MtN3 and saliva related transmembrane protein
MASIPAAWIPTLVGGIAAALTTIAFIPQLIRVWKLRRADEISLATFLLFSLGTSIWLVYGLLLGSLPIILANAITLVIAASILALKMHWERGPVVANA